MSPRNIRAVIANFIPLPTDCMSNAVDRMPKTCAIFASHERGFPSERRMLLLGAP